MKRLDFAIILGFVFTVFLCGFTEFSNDYNELKSNVIRLHIPANSDSVEDQNLKLQVRDRILKDTKNIFQSDLSYSEMEQNVKDNLSVIEEIAENEIHLRGYDYPVKAEYVNMHFDDRTYGEVTLPEGDYNALRITIGSGEGHNWWCMMYPSLCIPAAVDWDEYNETFTQEEINIMKHPQKFKFRLKSVELFEKLKKFIEEKLG